MQPIRKIEPSNQTPTTQFKIVGSQNPLGNQGDNKPDATPTNQNIHTRATSTTPSTYDSKAALLAQKITGPETLVIKNPIEDFNLLFQEFPKANIINHFTLQVSKTLPKVNCAIVEFDPMNNRGKYSIVAMLQGKLDELGPDDRKETIKEVLSKLSQYVQGVLNQYRNLSCHAIYDEYSLIVASTNLTEPTGKQKYKLDFNDFLVSMARIWYDFDDILFYAVAIKDGILRYYEEVDRDNPGYVRQLHEKLTVREVSGDLSLSNEQRRISDFVEKRYAAGVPIIKFLQHKIRHLNRHIQADLIDSMEKIQLDLIDPLLSHPQDQLRAKRLRGRIDEECFQHIHRMLAVINDWYVYDPQKDNFLRINSDAVTREKREKWHVLEDNYFTHYSLNADSQLRYLLKRNFNLQLETPIDWKINERRELSFELFANEVERQYPHIHIRDRNAQSLKATFGYKLSI